MKKSFFLKITEAKMENIFLRLFLRYKVFFVLFFMIFSLSIQTGVHAQGPTLVPEGGIEDSKYTSGDYEVNDFIQIAVNVSEWILILAGSLSLLAFVVGGLMFILSSGNKELVEKGKASLKGAVIGLAVVFFAFTAISYFMDKMGYEKNGDFGNWYSTN